MDDEIDGLMVGVRVDSGGFARDVEAMRASLEEGLGGAAARTGGLIEASLARAIRSGKLGFDDLKRVALSTMGEIAAGAVRSGIGAILGGGGGGLVSNLLGAALGLPGRAGGGPVVPGRGYVVGERGPELFVPGAGGVVVPPSPAGGGSGRTVNVTIRVDAGPGEAAGALARSGRQVARAVRAALEAAEA